MKVQEKKIITKLLKIINYTVLTKTKGGNIVKNDITTTCISQVILRTKGLVIISARHSNTTYFIVHLFS